MAHLYWVDDEIDRESGMLAYLEVALGQDQIVTLRTASEARKAIPDIQRDSAPVIVDLTLPPGPEGLELAPESGFALVTDLADRLGHSWPIFILSGNVTRGMKQQLIIKGIILSHIFSKPLNQHVDIFLEAVLKACKDHGSGGPWSDPERTSEEP
jgi:hypothetical protein